MAFGRNIPDDEQSVLVQNARKVQLDEEREIDCRSAEDAEVLRTYLDELRVELAAAVVAAKPPRAPRKPQD